MTDGHRTAKVLREDSPVPIDIIHEAEVPMGMKPVLLSQVIVLTRDNARAFLSPVLLGKKTKITQLSRCRMSVDPKNCAVAMRLVDHVIIHKLICEERILKPIYENGEMETS